MLRKGRQSDQPDMYERTGDTAFALMPQSRLMSLPPELRLRIFEYALDSFLDPPAYRPFCFARKDHSGSACCAFIPSHDSRRCHCAMSDIATALLRANKQIFAEATPVLCKLMELRVRIPRNDGPSITMKELSRVLDTMSTHAHQNMQQLLLVAKDISDTHRSQPQTVSLAGLYHYWKVVQQRLPKLRGIRVHLDLTTLELKNFESAIWAFKGIAKIPSLKLFQLELHQNPWVRQAWSAEFMEDTQAALVYKILQHVGGSFELDVVLFAAKAPMLSSSQ